MVKRSIVVALATGFLLLSLGLGVALGQGIASDEAQDLQARIKPLLVMIKQSVPFSVTLSVPLSPTETHTITVPALIDLDLQIRLTDTLTPTVQVITPTAPALVAVAEPAAEVPSELGTTRDNPVPFAEPFLAPDGYEITVLGFNEDAWPEVEEENSFNDPPLEGRRMVMVRMRVKNVASEEDPAVWWSNVTALLGSYHRPWSTFGDDSSCGVVPDDLDMLELYHGGSASGNVCFQIPMDETDLLLRYEYDKWEDGFVYFEAMP